MVRMKEEKEVCSSIAEQKKASFAIQISVRAFPLKEGPVLPVTRKDWRLLQRSANDFIFFFPKLLVAYNTVTKGKSCTV